jgi:hypothetical protein
MSEHLSVLLGKLQTSPSDFSGAETDAERQRRIDFDKALHDLQHRQQSQMLKLEQEVESGRLDLSQKLEALNQKYERDRRYMSDQHEKQIRLFQLSNHT